MYILVQKGQNDQYSVRGQKRAKFMKEYLLSDICADLANYKYRWAETWILHL